MALISPLVNVVLVEKVTRTQPILKDASLVWVSCTLHQYLISILFLCEVYGWEVAEFIGFEREEPYTVELVLIKGFLELFFSGLRYDVVLAAGGNASKRDCGVGNSRICTN